MAEAAVSSLLENLTLLLKHESRLITGAESELRKLIDDVARLKDFLRHTPTTEFEMEIRDAVNEVEDTIDACLSRAAEAKGKCYFLRLLHIWRIRLAKVAKSIRESQLMPIIDKIREKNQNSEARSASREELWIDRHKDHAIRRDNIVGLEDEARTIISYILEEKARLDVIFITGMPGIGKSTLASKIYRDTDIVYAFPIQIWIYVSQKFNKKELFLNIMRNITSQDMSNLSNDELAQIVSQCLKQERFLLILDDVWSLDDLKFIQKILPWDNGMGKVIITSHNDNLGQHENVYRAPFKLRLLTVEESWILLQLEVFGNLHDCPPELEEIGKTIAEKCDGLPLQIILVAGILASRLRREEWMGVMNVEISLSSFMELAYNELPNILKVCFLYMGVFPEDNEISAWTLIRLWIAEGLVQHVEGKSLEEIGNEYLNDLISRNLVTACRLNTNDEVRTCRVHHMIRTFCVTKVQEENLFQVIESSHGIVDEPPVSDQLKKSRRLCVHSGSEVLSQLLESKRVRSILCFTELDPRHQSAIPGAFILLKVWESKSLRFKQMPSAITRLFHLRYITLSIDNLDTLPETLSDLWNLQTLVVETTSRLITIKSNIWRLFQLRHLKTNASIFLSSKGGGEAGENLQTLDLLSPESCTLQVSKRARNLKRLGIRGKLDTFFKERFLENLHHLEKLKLMNELVYESSASDNPLWGLPRHSFFPPNLKSLTLSNTFFKWEDMFILAEIKSLEVLKLKENAFVGMVWSAADDCFSSLQFLLISNTNLFEWQVSTSSFPKLSCLVLKTCENLNEIPMALADTLNKLDIYGVRTSAVESARRISEKKKEKELENPKWTVPFKLYIGLTCY